MRLSHYSTVSILSLLFTLVFTLTLLTFNIQKNLEAQTEQKNWTLELTDLNSEQIQSLKAKLDQHSAVISSRFISQQQSLDSFKANWSSMASDLLKDPMVLQSIPDSIEIQVQSTQTEKLKTEFSQYEGVFAIDTGEEWTQKYIQMATWMSYFSKWLLALFSIGSLFIFSYVIQGSVQSKQKDIEVLELVGATSFDIRKPFLVEGLLLGFSSGLLALAGTYFVLNQLQNFGLSTPLWSNWISSLQFFPFQEMILLLTLTSCLGALSSYFFVRRMNTGWSFHKKSAYLR